jgi:hypothetical protein
MSKPKKEVRLHIYVDAPMAEALRQVSEETGAPVAEIIRRAIHSTLYAHPLVKASASGAGATHPQVVFTPKRESR